MVTLGEGFAGTLGGLAGNFQIGLTKFWLEVVYIFKTYGNLGYQLILVCGVLYILVETLTVISNARKKH